MSASFEQLQAAFGLEWHQNGERILNRLCYIEGDGPPTFMVPAFVGQEYFDRVGRVFYKGAGLTLGSFKAIGYDPISSLGSDLLGYWDASRPDTMTIAGGAVSSWRDLVAGYDAAQATGAAQPLWSASSFGGDPGLTFDGSDDCLTLTPSPFPSGATPSEIWVLGSQDAVPPGDTGTRVPAAYGDAAITARTLHRIVSSGVNRFRGACGDGAAEVRTTAVLSVDFSGRHVVRAAFGASSTAAMIDNSLSSTAAVVPATASARMSIGSASTTLPAGFWLGQIAAVLVTKPLSTDKADALRDWLMARRRL